MARFSEEARIDPREMPSPLDAVLETCVYYSHPEQQAMVAFYRDTLALTATGGDGFAYRVGGTLVLLFDRDEARAKRSPRPPAHGTEGSSHLCFLAGAGYTQWRAFLKRQGVVITRDISWPGGQRSFYFEDPAGNVLEIADGDMWPT